MAEIFIGENRYDIDLVVFDKDGLMFQTQPFWLELCSKRFELIKRLGFEEFTKRWPEVFGIELENDRAKYISPTSIFALASPEYEAVISAALLVEHIGMDWTEAKKLAFALYDEADKQLELEKALIPHKGFPDIMHALKAAGIPYGVATSDTRDRVVYSYDLFGAPQPEFIITQENVERGKPFPDMLIKASELTGCEMSKIMMIGDSFVDAMMAKNAGAVGVCVPETEAIREKLTGIATEVIDSLEDIRLG